MNVTICNLTRFGDLLQSQATIADIHAAGHQIDLVCLDNFVAATQFLRHVRKVWPFPGGKLLADTVNAWPQAVAQLETFSQTVKQEAAPDCVLNLTPGAPSRLLASLLAPKGARPLGFGIDACGFGIDYGVWASFFSVAARKRVNSPFNLADMMRMMAAPISKPMQGSFRVAPPNEASRAWAVAFTDNIPQAEGFVAFQLGASEERRRWPVSHFRQLGQTLWDNHRLAPILLGSRSENPLAEEYMAARPHHPLLNAVGATDLPKLAALLGRVKLLVTNDTGTMHLASGLGAPCLAFFFATAQPWDTGPMLPGCCCLEPAIPCHPCAFGQKCQRGEDCRQSVSPHTAETIISSWLKTGAWQGESAQDVRVWLTSRDASGFYELQPLSPAAMEGPGLWLAWMRIFWRQLFDNMDAATSAAPQENIIAAYKSLRRPDNAGELAATLQGGAAVLDIISETAKEVELKPQLANLFLRNCDRLQAFWNKMPELEAISGFWQEFRNNQGGDMRVFSNRCAIMAAHVRALAQVLNIQNAV